MTLRSSLIRMLLLVGLGVLSGCSPSGKEVAWTSGQTSLSGTLYLPGEKGPHPAVIVIPGSGTLTRSQPFLQAHVSPLTSAGVAVLLYDKRGCGQSTGEWRQATFEDLADDVVAAAAMLRTLPEIDAARIGLLGHSQGGWVALLAAQRDEHIAFLVSVAGPMTTPAAQDAYILARRLRTPEAARAGLTDSDVAEAIALHRQIMEVYRTDSGWDEAHYAVSAASSKRWFPFAQLGIQSHDDWNWRWLRPLLDVDGEALVQQCDRPFLGVYGSNDPLVDGNESFTTLIRMKSTRSAPTDALLIQGGDHTLHRAGDSEVTVEYWAKLNEWIWWQIGPARSGVEEQPLPSR